MTQALTTTNSNQAISAGSAKYNEADIQQEMGILRAAFPKLDAPPEGLRALIIASKFSGLNPFRGEIYYVPKVGITVASKIKAADAVAWAQAHGNTLNIRFETLNKLHPEYEQINPQVGDVCEVCIIVSSKQRQEFYNWRIQVIDELKALGYKGRELEDELDRRCGKTPPETRAVGIIKAAEDFGDKYSKAQVFSRTDRAQKRALQKALNIGGFAAPDMRQYGGVRIEDERPASESTVESAYRVVESGVSGAAEMPYDDDEPIVTQAPPTTSAAGAAGATQAEDSQQSPAVDDAARADVSKIADLVNEMWRGAQEFGPTMSEDKKREFMAHWMTVLQAVNAQLTLRGLSTIKPVGKASDIMRNVYQAVQGLVQFDQARPETQPEGAQ